MLQAMIEIMLALPMVTNDVNDVLFFPVSNTDAEVAEKGNFVCSEWWWRWV